MGYRNIHAGEDGNTISAQWPHGVGCEHCRAHKLCNECGEPLDGRNGVSMLDKTHCPNGRCIACHGTICGIGPDHAPYRYQIEGTRSGRISTYDNIGHNQDLSIRKRGEHDAAYVGKRVAKTLHDSGFERTHDEHVIPALFVSPDYDPKDARSCINHARERRDDCATCRLYARLDASDDKICEQDIMRERSSKHGG